MSDRIHRVALIGPESTGKTTLCSDLAEHYKTVWVPEYSRVYISRLNRPYTKDDIIHCAIEQLQLENEKIEQADKFLFADTELIVAKVWLLDVFGEYPSWIDEKIIEKKYDLYLLTEFDLPFVEDPVRENPNRRQFFYDWYKMELDKRNFSYKILGGIGAERRSNAIRLIDEFFVNS